MRKISSLSHFVMLPAIAAAIFMASCIKDEVVDVPFIPSESETICFGVASDWGEYEDVTRSSVALNRTGNHELKSADGTFILPMGVYVEDGIRSANADKAETRGAVLGAIGNSFTVWASLANGDTSTLFFPAEGEAFEDDGTSYKSDPAYFWPGAGTLNFTAVANAPASEFVPNLNTAGTALESFTYTVPQDATAQNDIVLATESVGGANNATVPLNFKHIMTAVKFKVGTIVDGEIRSITIKNAYNKGTYLVDQDIWAIDQTSKGEFSVELNGGDVFEVTSSTAKDTPINSADAVLMMIPQVLPDDAEIEIEFYNDAAGNKVLKGAINGDVWDMNKTTNYAISIDSSFNIEIVPVGKLLDAHYIIKQIKVTVEDENEAGNGAEWTLCASIDGASVNDEAVTLLPESLDNITTTFPNHTVELRMIQNGYWCDKYVTRSGDNGIYTYTPNTTSARGYDSIKGTGNVTGKIVYVMIPENNSTSDRNIKITLQKDGNENVSKTIYMTQRHPSWNGDNIGDYGWETVDDDEDDKYGFIFTRKVDYVFVYTFNRRYGFFGEYYEGDFLKMTIDETKTYLSNNIMIPYAPSKDGFFNYIEYSQSLGRRFLVRLDYSVLNDIPEANSVDDGLANTLALYRLAGKAGSIETIMSNTPKTFEGKPNDSTLRTRGDNDPSDVLAPSGGEVADEVAGILDYVLKKNKHYLYKSTETVDFAAPILLSEDDINWYIPADGQFSTFEPNPNVTDPNGGDDSKDDYWSSHIGTYDATTIENSLAYRGDGVAEYRKETLGIIAVRKRDSNTKTGTVAVTVDNSSMAGGENGEAQWVN